MKTDSKKLQMKCLFSLKYSMHTLTEQGESSKNSVLFDYPSFVLFMYRGENVAQLSIIFLARQH